MKKMVKTLLTIVSMIAITLSVFLVSASAAGNTIGSATNLSIGSSCSGTLSSTNEYDYYKCNLSSSGKVHFEIVSHTGRTAYVTLYDSNGNEVDEIGVYYNENLGYCLEKRDCYFTKGVFYIKIESSGTGSYTISTSFTSANESFSETIDANDNLIGRANKISLDKTYKGQIGYRDYYDFYELNINSDCTVKIKAKSDNDDLIAFDILNSSYNTIKELRIRYDDNLGYGVLETKYTFSKGTYYIKIDGESIYMTGFAKAFYDFQITPVKENTEQTSSINKTSTTSVVDTTSTSKTTKPYTENTTVSQTSDYDDDYYDIDIKYDPTLIFYTYNNFTYEIVDSEIVIIDYFGNGNSVVIPSDINGMSVIEISDGAFDGTDVEEITVPHTIIKFGENAFGQNDNTDVVIICDKNSAAEVYANKNGIDCQIKDEISDKSDEMNSEINNRIPKEYIVPGIVLLIIIAAVTVALLVKKNKNDIKKTNQKTSMEGQK